MLALQMQILNSLTKAASDYADLYADLLKAYEPPAKSGRSWYRPPPPDPFSSAWPFATMPTNYTFSPLYAFALLGPWAWRNQPPGLETFFSTPVAMMNAWTSMWGLSPTTSASAQPFAQVWPWGQTWDQAWSQAWNPGADQAWDVQTTPSSALTPGYGLIKMSITFPDDTEIKFAFPGPPI